MCPRIGVDLAWLAGLWVAALLYFWPVLFGGQSFFYRDSAFIYQPQALITARSLAAGALPLWEPTIGLGYPFHADPHSMIFYPLNFVLLLPFPRGYNVFVVAHVALAGTFMYLLLRRWKLSAAAAGLGAVATMFCGYTVSCTSLTTLLRGSVWAIAAVLAFDYYLESGSWRSLVATALVLAVQGSGTDPQYTFFAWLLLAGAPWLRPVDFDGPLGRWAAGLVAIPAVTGSLLAYQYLPLAELIGQSNRSAGLARDAIGAFGLQPSELLNLAVPLPFASDSGPYFLSSILTGWRLYTDLFWGVPMLALAGASLAWRAGKVQAGSALSTLVLTLGYSTPAFALLMLAAPPARAFRYAEKYLLLSAFALAAACALGFEGVRLGKAECHRTLKRWLDAMSAGLLLFGAALWLIGPALLTRLTKLAVLPAEGSQFGPGFNQEIVQGWYLAIAAMVATAASCRLALSFLHNGRPRLGLALLWLAAAGTLAIGTSRALPLIEDAAVAATPGTVSFLGERGPGRPPPRFLTIPETSSPPDFVEPGLQPVCRWMLHMLSSMRGCIWGVASVVPGMSVGLGSIRRIVEQLGAAPEDGRRRIAAALGATRSLEVDVPGAQPPGTAVAGRSQGAVVRELQGATPRAFIAGRATPSAEPVQATTGALLRLPGEALFEGSGRALSPRSVQRCRIVEYEASRLAVEFELEGEGLLVVLDQHYPGWKAFVDGRERPIARVAGLVRGVEVRGGERRLEMKYEPRMFGLGLAITLTSLLLAGAALVLARGTTDRLIGALPVLRISTRHICWGWWLFPVAVGALLAWPAVLGPAMLFFGDTLSHHLPEAWLSASALGRLDLPGWEPALGLGRPAAAGLYPLAVLLLGPFPAAYAVFTFAHLPIAGAGMMALLRLWRLEWAPCVMGSAAMMLCGLTVGATSAPPLLVALAWTPVALAALEAYVQTGTTRWLLAAAAALALEGYGSDPAFLAATYALLLVWPWMRPEENARRAMAGALIAIALSAALAAPRILDAKPAFARAPIDPVQALLPRPITDPGSPYFIANFRGAAFPLYPDCYWGLPLLALALAALAGRRRRAAAVTWAVAVAGLFGWPVLAAPGLAVLGALGLEALRVRSAARLYAGTLAGGLAAGAAALVWLWLEPAGWPRAWSGAAVARPVLEHLGQQWERVVLLALQIPALLLLLAAFRSRMASGAFCLAAAALTVCDLAHVADRNLLLSADPRVIEADPTSRLIPREGPQTRIVSYPPNDLSLGHGMTLLDFLKLRRDLQAGLHGVPLGLQPVVDLSSPRSEDEARLAELFAGASGRGERDRLAAALGASAALSPEGLGNAPGPGPILGRAGAVVVRAIPSPSPRAFIAARAEPGPREPSREGLLHLRERALYEGGAEVLAPGMIGPCAIRTETSDSVEIEVDLAGRGLLVLLDAFDPGWTATVDGQPRPVHRVAGLVRGVAVSGGERIVRMRYR